MAFRPYCPKCGSHNIVLDKDRAGGWGNPQVMLHCICGKVYYGEENIRAMHAAQLKEWKADKASREAEQTAEVEREQAAQKKRRSDQTQREYQQQRRQEREAEKERKRLANLAWAEEVARKRAEPETPEPKSLSIELVTCAWTPCVNSARGNSKYCSVDCKNRNARHRYKERKRAK